MTILVLIEIWRLYIILLLDTIIEAAFQFMLHESFHILNQFCKQVFRINVAKFVWSGFVAILHYDLNVKIINIIKITKKFQKILNLEIMSSSSNITI